jgi:hypothetical protein
VPYDHIADPMIDGVVPADELPNLPPLRAAQIDSGRPKGLRINNSVSSTDLIFEI